MAICKGGNAQKGSKIGQILPATARPPPGFGADLVERGGSSTFNSPDSPRYSAFCLTPKIKRDTTILDPSKSSFFYVKKRRRWLKLEVALTRDVIGRFPHFCPFSASTLRGLFRTPKILKIGPVELELETKPVEMLFKNERV